MGFLSGEGASAAAPTGSSSGDLSGTTGTVNAAAQGQVGGASAGTGPSPTNPNAAASPAAPTGNPTTPTQADNVSMDALVNMRMGSPTPTQTYTPTGQTPSQPPSVAQTMAAPSGTTAGLINSARSFLGTPYVYGGTSHSGIDCSGFTQAAYAGIGKNIGRDTSAQFRSGQAVGQDGNWAADVQQLQPGDLIFYGKPGATGPNAHVVMYVGNGQVMQAAHTGTNVEVSKLFNSASSDEPFLGVRRYV